MKILWTLFIFLFLNTAISGQAVISGTINQTTARTATLYFNPTTLGDVGETIEATIENGQFQFEINPLKSVPVVVEIGEFQSFLFLFPEKSLQFDIQIDKQNRSSISFEGVAAFDNHFFLQYQKVLIQEKKNLPQKLLEKFKPKNYLAYQTKLKQRKIDYLQKNQSKIDERLFFWLKNDIIYQFSNDLFEYPNRELITHTPPKKYYSFLKEIKLNNNEAILQPSYQRFLLGYTNYQLFKPQKWGRYASAEKQFEFVRRYFLGETLSYLQFFILKTSLKFEESSKVENAYREYLTSNAPEGFKRQLRQAHQLANQDIIGQIFPESLLQNQYGTYFNTRRKKGNAKLFYIYPTIVKEDKVKIIEKLANKINEKKYLEFGLVSLVKGGELPKRLSFIPYYWIEDYTLGSYLESFPIKDKAYLVLMNRYGEVIEYITWNIGLESVNGIVDFLAENYNSRVYSTLPNRLIRPTIKVNNYDR